MQNLTKVFFLFLLSPPMCSKVANLCHVPSWWTWNLEPWILFAPVHLDSSSDLTTLSLVSGCWIQMLLLNLGKLDIEHMSETASILCEICAEFHERTLHRCVIVTVPQAQYIRSLSLWCGKYWSLSESDTSSGDLAEHRTHCYKWGYRSRNNASQMGFSFPLPWS